MPLPPAILLFAHGSRTPGWEAPFVALCDRLQRARPDRPVALAFLELMQPDLATGIAELAERGATRIIVCPLFLGGGGHVTKDLPALVAAVCASRPGLVVDCLPPLGELPEVLDAIAGALLQRSR